MKLHIYTHVEMPSGETQKSTGRLPMFLGIGFVLSLAIAFGSPYLWDSSENPALLAALTTAVAFLVLCGGGLLLDRRRKKKHSIS